MVALLLCLALLVAVGVLGRALLVIGMRNGDRVGDATVGSGEPDARWGRVSFVVRNPGPQPVLIGASLRQRNLRLPGDAGQSVSVPRRTLRHELLAGQHTVVCAIPAGEAQTLSVPISGRSIRRRAELVVVIGEPDRLRVVRQSVELPRQAARGAKFGRRPGLPSKPRHKSRRTSRWPYTHVGWSGILAWSRQTMERTPRSSIDV